MDLQKLVALVSAHWTTALGWLVALVGWVGKRKVERRLRDIERRGEAPYLVATSCTAHVIEDPVRYLDINEAADRLDTIAAQFGPSSLEIRLRFANQGKKVRAVRVAESWIALANSDGVLPEGPCSAYFRYTYDGSKKGLPAQFVLHFETFSGVKQEHTYELIHATPSLRRVKPE